MKFIVTLGLVLAAMQAQAGSVPSGWKAIKDNGKGKCQMAVPSDWKEQEMMGHRLGAAKSPDGKLDAVINLHQYKWDEFKPTVFLIYTKEKNAPKIEDTSKRLWFNIVSMGDSRSVTQWYVAVPAGNDGTCNAQVNFKKGDKKAEALARQVVESIGTK